MSKISSRVNTLLATSATALMSACAVAPYGMVQERPTSTVEKPYGELYGESIGSRQINTTSAAYAAAPTLGVCVSETAVTPAANGNNAAALAAVRTLQLEGASQLRTNFMLNCGYTNPAVTNVLASNGLTPQSFLGQKGKPGPATAVPAFPSISTINTGYYLDASQQTLCTGTLVLVADQGQRIGGHRAGTRLQEWGGVVVPAGMIAPTQPVLSNGRMVASSMLCTQNRTETMKVLQ